MAHKIKDKPASKTKEKNKEPEQFKVVLLNDDYTTMEFVVEILMKIFHKNTEDAFLIMLNVHKKGRGEVGIYTWDIAVTKTEQVHAEASANQFPLRCIIEPA
ncbi:MAG: ATP-dependent Clp protease adaptor ClpS [Treponema sp.]|jgi:ATP-dependent Clp protease adaptor protein ClpS|nr:ATP-dependent Clp protease adaptor ClpS [Treponema sp.]